tara:strand:+ start:7932 stop:8516 length:585 start_codon:yes stop_codon:yes gene_type:complete
MKTSILFSFFAFAAVNIASVAHSQEIAIAPIGDQAGKEEVTEAALAASYRLLDSTNYSEQLKASVFPMALTFFNEGLDRAGKKAGIELDEALVENLRSAMVEELDLVIDEYTKKTRIEAAFVYAKYYEPRELDRLAEIYTDPVMQKTVEIGPKIQVELVSLGMDTMREYQPRIEQRMKEVVEQYLAQIIAEERS